jgi:hypothetical protein
MRERVRKVGIEKKGERVRNKMEKQLVCRKNSNKRIG